MTVLSKRLDPFFSLANPFLAEEIFQPVFKSNYSKGSIPAANIVEEKDKFLVQLAVPGLKKEDFKIELKEKLLSISVEKSIEKEQSETQPTYNLKEFGFASFKRSFTLPETIELEAITAQYEQGVLQLDIPKKDSAKINTHRLIEIN
jgi:HSP20 family protein